MYLGTPQSSPRARAALHHAPSYCVELQSLSLQRVSVTGERARAAARPKILESRDCMAREAKRQSSSPIHSFVHCPLS